MLSHCSFFRDGFHVSSSSYDMHVSSSSYDMHVSSSSYDMHVSSSSYDMHHRDGFHHFEVNHLEPKLNPKLNSI